MKVVEKGFAFKSDFVGPPFKSAIIEAMNDLGGYACVNVKVQIRTTILAGAAVMDGSTIVSTNRGFSNMLYAQEIDRIKPEDQLRHYKVSIINFEIDLPDNPVRYTAVPDAIPKDGSGRSSGSMSTM